MAQGKGQGKSQSKSAGATLSQQPGAGGTGPNSGIGAGERDRGTPEDATFKKERIAAKGLDPRGVAVGSFTIDGPSLTGEAKVSKGVTVQDAVRQLSEEVEKEPLPIENREQIQRFHELLLGGGTAGNDKPSEK